MALHFSAQVALTCDERVAESATAAFANCLNFEQRNRGKAMNLNALRYFLEVAKCKSIRRASERLHVAASAISRQISALEHELDCVLLDRRSDGVRLTEAGERLWAHGLKIEAQLHLVQSDIDDLRALHRGEIRITTVEGITENFLPRILTEFNEAYPDVTFEIVVASRDETVDALDRYQADIGFVYDFSNHHALEAFAHYHQPLKAFVPSKHTLADGRPIELPELMGYDHVLPDSSFGISQLIKRIAKKQKAQVAPKTISNKLQFLRSYALLNNAVFFVPAQAVYSEINADVLVPVNLQCSAFDHRHLSIARRRQRALSPAAELFAKFAEDRFSEWEEKDEAALKAARKRWWINED
ncbi:LysR family transcriptional regulator [Epibacterium ulvae]|uniref:LysR family transcriptional regulator n=1 Tax=Epibacterium ulvae TaxID=1156985 RepID=UPI001BFC3D4F|nr:LysR family transcriptional regulator [Epibacterium ulvae]MBT8154194.1 LysR family transcriptional regulator [Epibacterium ulvae]